MSFVIESHTFDCGPIRGFFRGNVIAFHRSCSLFTQRLWNTVDRTWTAKTLLRWKKTGFSTIHKPYHYYKRFKPKRSAEEMGTT